MGLVSLSPVFSVFLLSLVRLCSSGEKLTPETPLIFPDDKLISNNGVFALGFFSPTNSSRSFYIGIWYNNIPERLVVWVANRDNPITTPSSATLKVTKQSDLVLSDHEGRVFWTTKNNITTMGTAGEVPSVTLVNEGNLVLRSWNGTILWQSFDHPTDTLLPGMPFRLNYRTRFTDRLVSWKSPDNPSSGNFSIGGDVSSGMQIFIWDGPNLYWRSSAWSGQMVSWYKASNDTSTVIMLTISANGDEISATYSVSDGSPGVHGRMTYTGTYVFRVWNTAESAWSVLETCPAARCDHYAACGPFSYCDSTEPVPACKCLDGFRPLGTNPGSGCAREQPLRCGEGDNFAILQGMKTPALPVFVRNRSFDGCTAECRSNCSCTAYAYANLTSTISGGDSSRCLIWSGDLVDMAHMGKKVNFKSEDLYLRLAGSPGTHRSYCLALLGVLLPVFCCVVRTAAVLFFMNFYECMHDVNRYLFNISQRLSSPHNSYSAELPGR